MKKWCFYGKIFYDVYLEYLYKWLIISYMLIIKFLLVIGGLVYIIYDRLDIFVMFFFLFWGKVRCMYVYLLGIFK